MSNVNFKNFDDIKVSTYTFIAVSNIKFAIDKMFDEIPLSDIQVETTLNKKGNNVYPAKLDKFITSPAIVTLEYENKLRGLDLKNKLKNKKRKFFRNSFTIVAYVDKIVNVKLSRNGKFQMTGCSSIEHAEKCVKYILSLCDLSRKDIYDLSDDSIKVYYIPSMANLDFSLGFLIDREKLDMFFKRNTEYISILETSFGYTGINIKIPISEKIDTMPILLQEYGTDRLDLVKTSEISYKNYMDEYDKDHKLSKKRRYITFLVFHSGRVIISGIHHKFSKSAYNTFIDIIKKSYDNIIDKTVVFEKKKKNSNLIKS